MIPFFISSQCFTFNFLAAYLSMYCWNFSLFFVSNVFFRASVSPVGCSLFMPYFSISCSIVSLHMLLLFVKVWISLAFIIVMILFTCISFLLFIYRSMLWNPVPARWHLAMLCHKLFVHLGIPNMLFFPSFLSDRLLP